MCDENTIAKSTFEVVEIAGLAIDTHIQECKEENIFRKIGREFMKGCLDGLTEERPELNADSLSEDSAFVKLSELLAFTIAFGINLSGESLDADDPIV